MGLGFTVYEFEWGFGFFSGFRVYLLDLNRV